MNTLKLSSLSTEHKNILIAEVCGFEIMLNNKEARNPMGRLPGGDWVILPRYTTSLDGAQLAFSKLDARQKRICTYATIDQLEKGQYLFDATSEQWVNGILLATGKAEL